MSGRIAFVGRKFLPAADVDTAPSFLRFAAIQGIERKQDLAGLAPEGCFISAEAVKRVVGQIGQAQKATREVSVKRWQGRAGCRPGARRSFRTVCAAVRCRTRSSADRISPPEQGIESFLRRRIAFGAPA